MNAEDFLKVVAGTVCPCGHEDVEHDPPNPDFRVGDFVEVRGACKHCDCAGEVASA